MPPDIMAGLLGQAGATGVTATGATAGPPGPPGLAALFAALLAQSSGPPVTAANALPAPVNNDPAKNTEPTRPDWKLFPLSSPLLPITNRQIINRMTMRPTFPQKAGVPAETQNAMDTVPVSVSPKVKTTENKPGGELPLPDAKAAASLPLPVFPGFLITPARPAMPLLQALPQAVATQSPGLPAALPLTASAEPASALLAALPKTFTLPVVQKAETGEAMPVTVPVTVPVTAQVPAAPLLKPVPSVSNVGAGEQAVPLPTARPQAQTAPYAVTAKALSVPAAVIAPEANQPVVAVTNAVSLPPTALSPASVVIAPTPADAPTAPEPVVIAAASPLSVMPTPPAIAPALRQAGERLPVAVAATVPVKRQELPGAMMMPAPSSVRPPQRPAVSEAPKTPLKSGTAAADNNTGIQPQATGKTIPTELRLQVVGKRSERNLKSAAPEEAATPAVTPLTTAPAKAAAATPAPLTQTERAEMIRQVAEGVEAMRLPAKPEAAQQMTLQLHPKDWGQIQISVKVVPGVHPDAAQAVTAHIVAETPQIKAALENGSSDLRHALREAGLHLDRLTVTVQALSDSGQAGTASSGGHHLMNGGGGGLGQSQPEARGSSPQSGPSSFATFTGHPQDRRQDGQPQAAYAGAYATAEPDHDETPEWEPPRPTLGQWDMRA